jgi:hypothetical protein
MSAQDASPAPLYIDVRRFADISPEKPSAATQLFGVVF